MCVYGNTSQEFKEKATSIVFTESEIILSISNEYNYRVLVFSIVYISKLKVDAYIRIYFKVRIPNFPTIFNLLHDQNVET